jgi:hypothetical protein
VGVVFFGLARKVRKKHYKIECLHACGWVVKAVFCCSNFVKK